MEQLKDSKKNNFLIIFSYIVVYIVWGSTYFFIKAAVQTIPPFYVVSYRFIWGGIFFLVFALISRRFKKLPSLKEILAAVFLGTFLLIGGNGLITIAEKKVDSYLVALIIASTPLAVAVFDRILLKKKLSKTGLVGILLGIFGVAFLLYDGNSLFSGLTIHVILVIAGLISWAFATSLGHCLSVYPDSFVNSAIQMLFVGIVSYIGVSIAYQRALPDISHYSLNSTLAVVYLALIGNSGFIAYTFLIQNEPAGRVVSYAFVNPLIALVLGITIGQEKSKPLLLLAIPCILVGLMLMLYGNKLKILLLKKDL
jgi:drug/metabolite transporter (DMT)-like permease